MMYEVREKVIDARGGRCIVIGDLHGCYDETIDLLNACEMTATDIVIFTGDLVDRGPKPRECVELAMEHHSILGNHEERHLQYRQHNTPIEKLPPHHARTVQALDENHWNFIKSLPLMIKVPEYDLTVIHAGLWPYVPIEKQDSRHLLHLQCVTQGPQKKSSWPGKSKPGTFWTNYREGTSVIVFGHTGLNKPLRHNSTIGIDTGCVFGRTLTAYILPDDRFVQVEAKKSYYHNDHHAELGKTDWLKLIPIYGDVCTFS